MNRIEVRTVKRQLESYRDYLALAKQQEAESTRLQKLYERKAGAKCIPIDRNASGQNTGAKGDVTSQYLEIFSRQKEADEMACEYRKKAQRCFEFIQHLEGDRTDWVKAAYLDGKSYQDIALEAGYTKQAIHWGIIRCLEETPAKLASAVSLL